MASFIIGFGCGFGVASLVLLAYVLRGGRGKHGLPLRDNFPRPGSRPTTVKKYLQRPVNIDQPESVIRQAKFRQRRNPNAD